MREIISNIGYPRAKAFSLLELLIALAIIGALAAILIPSINIVRSSAKKMDCMNRHRQTGLAMLLYTQQNKGYFPFSTNGDATGSEKKMWYSIISEDWSRAVNMTTFDHNLVRNFFCSEDPNQRPSSAQLSNLQTQHYLSIGYNKMGLGEQGGTVLNPTGMARLTNITAPAETIMLGDTWNVNTDPSKKYGFHIAGWEVGMGTVIYPRHSGGKFCNITLVDGRCISIKADNSYDYNSLYRSVSAGGVGHGNWEWDSSASWWDR